MTLSEPPGLVTASGPLVTIAIPTFNRASLLAGAINAALTQSYQNFEIIVSDNASSDETSEVLKQYSDRRLFAVRQERNIGLIANLNALLKLANGQFIVFVPDDDRIAPWMLERCMALVRSDPEIPVIVTLCDVYFVATDRTWCAQPSKQVGTGIVDGSRVLLDFFRDKISVAMCSVMYRTDKLRSNGGFPADFPYATDVASWAPLLLEGKAGLVNESCARLALHETSQTTNFDIDVRVRDGRRIVEIVAGTSNSFASVPKHRRKLVIESRRYFARRTIEMLAAYRRDGAAFPQVMSRIWQFHQDIVGLGVSGIAQMARSLIILFLPVPASWFRQVKRLSRRLRREVF